MEYENKEAKKFVQWFLLCSVIILLLTGTVTTLVVRNYRARENEAVTAMLGIVLKNDGSDTEESRQEKISECMRMLEHPHAYQKSHQKEIKEAEKILQSYTQYRLRQEHRTDRRGRLAVCCWRNLQPEVCFSFIRNGGVVNLQNCRITWKKSSVVIMIWHWRTTRRMN